MLLLLLPIQGAGYWVLLALSGMRHRTSLLIVAALGVADGWLEPEWLVKLAVAVAGSFVIAAILNPRNTSALSSFAARFPSRPPEKLNIHDRPIPFGDATALVLGMGRVGSAAYQQLELEHGLNVLGVEHDPARVTALEKRGIDAIEGDATDTDFWDRVMRRAHGDQAPKIHGDGRGPLHRSSPGPARTPHRLASSDSSTHLDVALPLQ